jgi:PEP-CTERM/exosortase A-associated glycosyltransferase
MRILHVLDHSTPLQSGYTFRTLAILRQQRALGWETLHLTSPKHAGSQAPEEEIDGWHFYRTTMDGSLFAATPVLKELVVMARTLRRIQEVVRRHRPDVIHAHSPVLNAIPALRAGRQFGIPVVYEVRALWEDAAVDHGTARHGGLRYRLSRALETYALRRADAVTTICEGLRREIIARGIAPDRITVIPNAVDVEAFKFGKEPDEELRAQLGLEGKLLVGFVGSFYAYEGLDLLLGALPRILAERPEIRVLLVGGGPQEEQLKDLARRLGVADKVIFAGRVAHAEVHRYYGLIDLLAYPRRSMRLTELVTPLKPLEAMAQGQLLVASDVGGHRELIRDGDTGCLFPAGRSDALADAVVRLLRESDWSSRRLRARRFVESERNWRCSVERYRGVYADLGVEAS